MPLIRRLPKRGFNNALHRTEYVPVNVEALNVFEDGTEVTANVLQKAGLANSGRNGIKILGHGELKKKLTVKARAFSASAKQKIEAQGGSCETVQ